MAFFSSSAAVESGEADGNEVEEEAGDVRLQTSRTPGNSPGAASFLSMLRKEECCQGCADEYDDNNEDNEVFIEDETRQAAISRTSLNDVMHAMKRWFEATSPPTMKQWFEAGKRAFIHPTSLATSPPTSAFVLTFRPPS